MRYCLILLLSLAAFAKDSDFNGRWNIQVANEARGRVWWLEVDGAGSATPKGKFVGAPGGDLDVIPELSVQGGELRFAFERVYRVGAPPYGKKKGVYSARLVKGELKGTFALDGNVVYQWTGVRAPVIRDADSEGAWKPGRPQDLLTLSAWNPMVVGQDLGWTLSDGILRNKIGANNLISKEKFWNFVLKTEYRLQEKSNGGIGLRGRYEIQILQDYGKAQDTHSHGALYSRIKPAVNASKPAGEWNELEVRLVGRWLTVVLNGAIVTNKQEVEGLTAIAGDANEADPGPFILQGDHTLVEFRKFEVTPLTR
jgi:hypothetical protein